MKYVLLGLCAWPAFAVFEYASLKKIAGLKQVMATLTVALSGSSLVVMCVDGEKLALPSSLPWLGLVLAVVFGLLWFYSTFIEIPFAATYLRPGHGDRLITTGTYALARHPTVLWFALFLVGLVLATRSRLLLLAAPIWLAVDVLYVWMEEKLFLEKVFTDYQDYQQRTPMLSPTPRSLRRFLRTVRHQQQKHPEDEE